MKKAGLFIAFVLVFSCIAWAQPEKFHFEDLSLTKALKKSGRTGKEVMMYCHSQWCEGCRLMEKQVLPDSGVAAFYNRNFISLSIDMEIGEGKELAQKYGVVTFPAFLFLDKKGEVIHRIAGYRSIEDFIYAGVVTQDESLSLAGMDRRFNAGERGLDFLLDYYRILHGALDGRSREIAELYIRMTGCRDRFKQGERGTDFMEQYAAVLKAVGGQSDLEEFVPVYLNSLPPDKLATERNWQWLSYVRGLTQATRYVIENPFRFEEVAGGMKNVREFIHRALQNEASYYLQMLYSASDALDVKKCDSLIAYLQDVPSDIVPESIAGLKALKCLKASDYAGMLRYLQMAKKYNVMRISYAGSYLFAFLEKLRGCDDSRLLANAVAWMEPFIHEIQGDDTKKKFIALVDALSDKMSK